MSAASIARALGGRRFGGTWMARCPAHDDRQPSLAIRDSGDGKVLVKCHAGCSQRDVIDALKDRGIWATGGRGRPHDPTKLASTTPSGGSRDDADRTRLAMRLWHEAVNAKGTLVETYLRSRSLSIAPPSATLRFHPGLKHPAGGTWPAMVALVARGIDDAPVAVHRTFLATDGSSKAPVAPQKMMLGPCRGGAVRLGEYIENGKAPLMVGEGVESSLAAMCATGWPAWAALSTAGLRSLDLPEEVSEVVVLADGDDPGEQAARTCAMRWSHEGRRVRIARPPRGEDFADVFGSDSAKLDDRR